MYEEYLIYDWLRMVTSIGGALGLLIGTSLYNLCTSLIDLAFKLDVNRREISNLPNTNVSGQVAETAQEYQQISGDSRIRTRSHTHMSITECSTK